MFVLFHTIFYYFPYFCTIFHYLSIKFSMFSVALFPTIFYYVLFPTSFPSIFTSFFYFLSVFLLFLERTIFLHDFFHYVFLIFSLLVLGEFWSLPAGF